MARRTALPLWLPRLSVITRSPWSVGTSTLSTKVLKASALIGPSSSLHAIMAKRGQEGHGFPVAMGNLGHEPFSARRPSPERRHIGLGPGLIDEHQALGIDPALPVRPLGAPARDVGSIAFAAEQGRTPSSAYEDDEQVERQGRRAPRKGQLCAPRAGDATVRGEPGPRSARRGEPHRRRRLRSRRVAACRSRRWLARLADHRPEH
jgi:hypothetical protein